ncbi:hypothetical protein WJX72_007345 [[Myrmecia] bisecta]|uniref:DNA helicase n=1 Tax=[Myrmecia] bisecta TaxID=41462 RepID=A0AAW1PY77_9CHLO
MKALLADALDGPTTAADILAAAPALVTDHAQDVDRASADGGDASPVPRVRSGPFRCVAFDLETTGLHHSWHRISPTDPTSIQSRIVEIAAHALDSGKDFSTLINIAPVHMPYKVVEVTQITTAMLHDPSLPSPREAFLRFIQFVEHECAGGIPVLVAHHGKGFDVPMLQRDFAAAGVPFPEGWWQLDTNVMARVITRKKIGSENLKLGTLHRHFGFADIGAHRAMPDVRMLVNILPHLLDLMGHQTPAGLLSDSKYPQCYDVISRDTEAPDKSAKTAAQKRADKKSAAQRKQDKLTVAEAETLQQGADWTPATRQFAAPDPVMEMEAMMLDDEGPDMTGFQQYGDDWLRALNNAAITRDLIDVDIGQVKGIPPAMLRSLQDAGFANLWQLLQHYPRDYTTFQPNLEDGALVLLVHVNIVKFGPYYAKYANGFRPGSQIVLTGKVSQRASGVWDMKDGVDMYFPDKVPKHGDGIEPVYSQRKPIMASKFPKIIAKALGILEKRLEALRKPKASKRAPALDDWDALPEAIRQQHGFMGWLKALQTIHAPTTADEAAAARRRLAFEELLLLQLVMVLRREIARTPRNSIDAEGISIGKLDMMQAGRDVLPFSLTPGQEAALSTVLRDMLGPAPMLRLLQGDVGSGKTAVAFLALLAAAGSGYQGAIMAPTEVLAEQHYNNFARLAASMPPALRPRVELLTGNVKGKRRAEIYEGLAAGEVHLVTGTHALISEPVEFLRLGLAVIDEQHRFGVGQRARLQGKSSPPPHVLAMTATPIPRTLALVGHGDMAHCAIEDMPPGRKPVKTKCLLDEPEARAEMYAAVRAELEAGGRAFFILPLVEESKSPLEIKAAKEEYERLKAERVLGDNVAIGLLHGRLPPDQKLQALHDFSSGKTQVLVGTTVVEVGVDVPEASMIVIEHADRFGLAQLHQLRGRVGRGARQASCYMVATDPLALQRLSILERSHNGFQIAEVDLRHRGPGEILGKKQSGQTSLGCLKACDLERDQDLLDLARETAAGLIRMYGMNPSAWPKQLIAALKDQTLPQLDIHQIPVNSLADANVL